MKEVVTVGDLAVEVRVAGSGRPILFLHSEVGLGLQGVEKAFVERLSGLGEVYVPTHPGFGSVDCPKSVTSVDDISYVYADLVRQLGLRDAVVVGASFGAWVAMELLTKVTDCFSRFVAVGPLGVKCGTRDERDLVDIFAINHREFIDLSFADGQVLKTYLDDLSDEDLRIFVRARNTFANLGWSPYMHNPKLADRLHLLQLPALLLQGAADDLVRRDYAALLAARLPHGEARAIEGAGHYAHIDRPEAVAAAIGAFAGAPSPALQSMEGAD